MGREAERAIEERLRELAQEYEQEGYRVILKPDRAARPAFLADFEPSMIALGPDEHAVVLVCFREALIGNATFLAMVAAVEAAPGWRFDLATATVPAPPVVEEGAGVLEPGEIRARLGAARASLAAGQGEAALVLAWSALDASLRQLADEYDLDLDRKDSVMMIVELITEGLIDRDDNDFLREALRFRDLIVHGYRTPAGLSEVTERLIARAEAAQLIEAHPAAT
jgi:hypothetical protein